MLSPKEITRRLNASIIGQDDAKKTISTALYNHYSKIAMAWDHKIEVKLKNNVLILGPTGCGKTFLIEKAIETLDIPLIKLTALEIAPSGWAGSSIEDYIEHAIKDCKARYKNDWKFMLSHAVIYIDEIDKLFFKAGSSGGGDHNKLIQHSMLKWIEGCDIYLKNKYGEISHTINTSNMMFIFSGNFQELRKSISSNQEGIGFILNSPQRKNSIRKEIIKAGASQEFMGRISAITEINQLSRKEYKSILVNYTDGVLKPYCNLWYYNTGTQLRLSDYHINKIIDRCMEENIGARGLHAATEEVLREKFYNLTPKWEISLRFLEGKE